MDEISAFGQIAQYLTHPLVLVGFVLMLVFSIHKQLIQSGLLPKVTQKTGGEIIQTLLKYGFWLGLAIVVLGIILQLFNPS